MRRTLRHLHPIAAAVHRWLAALRSALYTVATGQGLVEYGLILVLIMVVCVAIIGMVGQTISQVWYDRLINGFPH
ncbi:Flp family type IVb pilin [Oscillochloris sp. ZM17-4]|uniref:Flp family type IVb pilin n=1 Tax=Oscillochloris sp. ZM17-4 TaxID=2866714 RepID=UPI0021049F98|nr:hypothetical protein [Oscillochloris sp. ZM17-4]